MDSREGCARIYVSQRIRRISLFKGPEPGSNGMTIDADGRVTVAGLARRNVWRLESLSPNAQITGLADTYQAKKLNIPNDPV